MLSICYVAPGHVLRETCGSTRNVLAVAAALSEWATVSVAFRGVHDKIDASSFEIIQIDPSFNAAKAGYDDVAFRGIDLLSHARYLRTLRRFALQHAGSFDLVYEKGWRISGYLVNAFEKRGTPGVLVENDVRHWSSNVHGLRSSGRFLGHHVAQRIAGYYSRRVPVVIAETQELRRQLTTYRGVSDDRIEVVGLGVDGHLFQEVDQNDARNRVGIDPDETTFVYVGGMDENHDLEPVIRAIGESRHPSVTLHCIGDGTRRFELECLANSLRARVRFHGYVPHPQIPLYISAADACIAPYRTARFPDGQVSFSTLKIPEYMSCRRPVISVPSGHIKSLIEHGVNGFLQTNEMSSWVEFIAALPDRGTLRRMGRRAGRVVELLSWRHTSARYLDIGNGLLQCR